MPPRPRPTPWRMYTKMFVTFTTFAVGGPALIYWVSPTEEELFKKYNPELQKRSLENRIGKQQDFDDFVGRLKVLSRSDKPIWEAAAIAEKEARDGKIAEQAKLTKEIEDRKAEIRKSGTKMMPGGSL